MADEYGTLVSRSWKEVDSVLRLMPRQNGCVRCDSSTKLSCPTGCPEGTECGYELLLDCQSCPKAVCVASSDASSNDADPTTETKSSGPNGGAIAGGVVAGVVLILVVTYLLWRFCIKPRRALETPQVYVEDVDRGTEKDLASRRDKRSSMHTVHSVASTVLTRASNIIQIAYIPGVTNRAPPPSPAVLVPPVPPIPVNFAQSSSSVGGSNPSSPYEDQHFFIPGNLRDSSYSGYSGYSDRTSIAGRSYAPRSSIASTIYGKNVTIQAPQTGMRVKPTVVSVRPNNGNNNSSSSSVGSATPPVPNIDFDKFGRPNSSISTFSVGSTFLSNATMAQAQSRGQIIKAGEVKKVVTPRQPATERLAPVSAAPPSLRSEPESPDQGPFSDPVDTLGAEIQDATRRAAKVKSIRSSTIRETSPFGDEHATREQ